MKQEKIIIGQNLRNQAKLVLGKSISLNEIPSENKKG